MVEILRTEGGRRLHKMARGPLRTADYTAGFHVYRWMQEETHREHDAFVETACRALPRVRLGEVKVILTTAVWDRRDRMGSVSDGKGTREEP